MLHNKRYTSLPPPISFSSAKLQPVSTLKHTHADSHTGDEKRHSKTVMSTHLQLDWISQCRAKGSMRAVVSSPQGIQTPALGSAGIKRKERTQWKGRRKR